MSSERPADHRSGRPPRRSRRLGTRLELSALAVVLIAVATALFRITGGRWMSVATPSMGRTAPVGTLALTRPTAVAATAVGDLIVFDSPGAAAGRYLHRVIGIDADGGLRTRGDLNGAEDPWTVHDPDLVGRVIALVPAAGWILQLLPVLLVGGLTVVVLIRTYVPPAQRPPAVAVGLSLVAAVALWVVGPLVRAATVTRTVVDGTLTVELVPTGLMTLDVRVTGGGAAVLAPGELGRLTSVSPGPDGEFDVLLSPHLGPAGWVVCLVISAVPSAVCLGWALRRDRAADPRTVPAAG